MERAAARKLSTIWAVPTVITIASDDFPVEASAKGRHAPYAERDEAIGQTALIKRVA